MPDSRPNVLLIMVDQMRADCLGIAGHPVVQTPNLDALAAAGARFSNGYSACPVCVPARRTLITGKKPSSHGVVTNYKTGLEGPTLPEVLRNSGYQTALVGKFHLWPKRKSYGFETMVWSDTAKGDRTSNDDYDRYLESAGLGISRPPMAHGIGTCSWMARPWHMEEQYHFSNWCADSAIDVLDRRDPTRPFFLNVNFAHPHPPCTPPRFYYDRYAGRTLPGPIVGEWAKVFDEPQRGLSTMNSWRVALEPEVMNRFRAAYYASIEHIDAQIGRILYALSDKEETERNNTVVIFVSDHGEMLGDHQWLRKRTPYEGSTHIPYLIWFPESLGIPGKQVIDAPVELMDIMPTLLDIVEVDIPDRVDGSSLLPLLTTEGADWREYLHGECSDIPTLDSGMHYLTDGKRKYIWFPGRGKEQFFDLEADPGELINLIDTPGFHEEIAMWRKRLVDELEGRDEGFVRDGVLRKLDGSTTKYMSGFEQSAWMGQLR